MDGKKLFAGYISGVLAIVIELIIFGGSFFVDMLKGVFPESASALSSSLSMAVSVGFLINLVIGIFAALDLGGIIPPVGILEYAVGFLAGVSTMLAIFGGILSSVAPQIVGGLWGEFLTVIIPILLVLGIAIAYELWQERQRYTVQW